MADSFALLIALSSIFVYLSNCLMLLVELAFVGIALSRVCFTRASGVSCDSSFCLCSFRSELTVCSVSRDAEIYCSDREGLACAALLNTRSIPPNFLFISSTILRSYSSEISFVFSRLYVIVFCSLKFSRAPYTACFSNNWQSAAEDLLHSLSDRRLLESCARSRSASVRAFIFNQL